MATELHADVCRVNAALERALNLPDAPSKLRDAMRYATLGGGKRIRPRLVYAAGRASGADAPGLDAAAAAVELLHAYSLVHDDLPAMDDDDLRRGRPTVHVAYDEATAILVGDALQALAFETLASAHTDAEVARRQLALLTRAAGAAGMVGGQVLDMEGESRPFDLGEVERTHRRKTGALIHAAVMLGASAGSLTARETCSLNLFAGEIGLAFQIRDDVLDETGSTEVLGKPLGSDARRGKSTYASLLGVDAAGAEVVKRRNSALAALAVFGERGTELAALADHLTRRAS